MSLATHQEDLFALDQNPPDPGSNAELPACLDVGPPPAGWPQAPGPEVYTGLIGDIVAALAPHTEADPVAILAQSLVAAGAVIGRGAHFAVEATRHHPNEYVLLVGESAKARKGSSWDHVARLLNTTDPGFATRTSTGLSSGEGLVWALRDPAGADPGAPDPRLLVVEAEFATVLKMTSRDVNTLSPVLRSAWDGRPLALLTRTAPARASAAHLAVIGHITAYHQPGAGQHSCPVPDRAFACDPSAPSVVRSCATPILTPNATTVLNQPGAQHSSGPSPTTPMPRCPLRSRGRRPFPDENAPCRSRTTTRRPDPARTSGTQQYRHRHARRRFHLPGLQSRDPTSEGPPGNLRLPPSCRTNVRHGTTGACPSPHSRRQRSCWRVADVPGRPLDVTPTLAGATVHHATAPRGRGNTPCRHVDFHRHGTCCPCSRFAGLLLWRRRQSADRQRHTGLLQRTHSGWNF